MHTISKHQLIAMNPCNSGLKRFIRQVNDSSEPISVISLIGGKNTTGDILWLAGRMLDKKSLVRFAVKCAEINKDKIKGKRLIAAINSANDWLMNPTEENRVKAAYAAAAAYAAYAADAAFKRKINTYLTEMWS